MHVYMCVHNDRCVVLSGRVRFGGRARVLPVWEALPTQSPKTNSDGRCLTSLVDILLAYRNYFVACHIATHVPRRAN